MLSIGEWSLDSERLAVKTFTLVGSGWSDRVKLKSAEYAFADGNLEVYGEYFGVGFEVVGTRADPQVFLKENALLKAVILQPDSGFFSEEFVAPAKRK
jgi:hypothetical protein